VLAEAGIQKVVESNFEMVVKWLKLKGETCSNGLF